MKAIRKMRQILQDEGVYPLISKLLFHLQRLIFIDDTYYVFKHTLDGPNVVLNESKVKLEMICTPEELALISAKGYDLSRFDMNLVQSLLSKQAILCCIFIDNRLAHESWVSTNRHANIDPIAPYFNYQWCAYIGACRTWPEYQGLGLYPYALSEICKFLKSMGLSRAMLTVSPDNKSSITGVAKAGFRQYGTGRYVRFLTMTSWRADNEI